MHGTQPGCYLVVGPDWRGTVPAGIAGVFRCPTRYGYCLPRVHVDGTEEDRLASLPAVNQIVAYPLAEFDGSPRTHDWSRSRWLPNLASLGRHQAGVSPETFFEALPEVLAAVPPLPGEESLYARFHGLIRAMETRPDIKAQAIAAAADADRDIVEPLFHFRNVGRPLPGHWTTVDNGASFGGDYLTRTAVAKSNVFVNTAQEARYYYLDLDALGERLEGGALPPDLPRRGASPGPGLLVGDDLRRAPCPPRWRRSPCDRVAHGRGRVRGGWIALDPRRSGRWPAGRIR